MALKFSCTACGEQIIVQYLKVNEIAKCRNCGAVNTVPDNATLTYESPDYSLPSSSEEKKASTIPEMVMVLVPTLEKASRAIRLAAFMIDLTLIYAVAFLSVGVANLLGNIEMFERIFGYVFFLPILAVQVRLLSMYGQTIGKFLLNIMIIKRSTGQNGGFFTNVILRVVVFLFFSWIDIPFIFRKDRRCLHDLIAGTEVVKAGRFEVRRKGIQCS